jgi:4-amino-4-deoxy-L-arabinose transferase-like glycosyltransferase
MVKISLFVELLRTRPLALFWTMAAVQAVLWTLVPSLFYSAPPGQLPVVLAIGDEYQLGTEFGPPLAFWLAAIAYRSLGLFGVYLLSQVCIVVTFWAVLSLGRAIVGEMHAVMAVLLMAGIAVFSVPTPEFGPAILAAPLWALILYHYWQTIRAGQWYDWIALGVEIGLLLLTTYAGLILVGLMAVYALATEYGRSQITATVGPWLAGVIAVVVLFPYLIWLDLAGEARFPNVATIVDNLRTWGRLIGMLVLAHLGLGFLVVLARGWVVPSRGPPPDISREPIDPAARIYVYFFALAPVVAMGLFVLFSRRPENFVGAPLVVMSGLAVVAAAGDRVRLEHQYLVGVAWAALLVLPPLFVALAIVVQPWTFAIDLKVGRPAAEMARFFSDNFQRRTGKPLAVVAGDPATAALISLMAPSRPSLYLEYTPEYLPRVSRLQLAEKGAIVVWPAADPAGRPPADIRRQFPGLVPEVPHGFSRRFQGRMPLERIGWGVIRPGSPIGLPASQ